MNFLNLFCRRCRARGGGGDPQVETQIMSHTGANVGGHQPVIITTTVITTGDQEGNNRRFLTRKHSSRMRTVRLLIQGGRVFMGGCVSGGECADPRLRDSRPVLDPEADPLPKTQRQTPPCEQND